MVVLRTTLLGMPTFAEIATFFPTWTELSRGIIVNLLTSPVEWLIALLIAMLLRDRKVAELKAVAALGERVTEARSPLLVFLDVVIAVAAIAVFGPFLSALVMAAAAVSLALGIIVVVPASAFLAWVIWWVVGFFTGRYDEPPAKDP